MAIIDIGNPDHNPEEVWGKFYFNFDKKKEQRLFGIRGTFTLTDVALFWGISKRNVNKVLDEDKSYKLLVNSWVELNWIREYPKTNSLLINLNFMPKTLFEPTHEGLLVARRWKKDDKKAKFERRHNNLHC